MQTITILGATGSVGNSTLDVVSKYPNLYQIYALTANTNVKKLADLCLKFKPKVAVVSSEDLAAKLNKLIKNKNLNVIIEYGESALCDVARANECSTVVAAIVGKAGLLPTLAAAKSGKRLLLANKESLVISGKIFIEAIESSGAELFPIDSEHNAIFQCLPKSYKSNPSFHGINKIILTASGGPFLNMDLIQLEKVTPEQAIIHPNWTMGKKISVDSANMMNKGLEVIEAYWLFGLNIKQIEVIIHPQSIIHSMVSFVDGSILAQLGNPDMRTPISYALSYPNRRSSGVNFLELTKIHKLTFYEPNLLRFPCLNLAFNALKTGGNSAAVLNAANEVAVNAFLSKKISFIKIPEVIDQVMNKIPTTYTRDLNFILEEDLKARKQALQLL